MPLPSPVYVDGDWTVAAPSSLAEKSCPFPGVNAEYILTQDWQQLSANWTPLALNTAHPRYPTFLLTEEGPRKDIGAGAVRWTRTYALKPSARNEHSSFSYRFIGYAGVMGVGWVKIPGGLATYVPGRQPFTATVPCRIQYDYYLVGAGGDYANETLIPIIQEQKYYYSQGTISGSFPSLVFTPTYPDPIQDALHGIPNDYVVDSTGPYALGLIPTKPSRTEYEALRVAGTEIVVETSQISRWMGNYWQRVTKYVTAI